EPGRTAALALPREPALHPVARRASLRAAGHHRPLAGLPPRPRAGRFPPVDPLRPALRPEPVVPRRPQDPGRHRRHPRRPLAGAAGLDRACASPRRGRPLTDHSEPRWRAHMTLSPAKPWRLLAATLFTLAAAVPVRAQAALFTAPRDFTVGTNPFSVALGDLDGDGKPDLVTANYGSNSVSVALGRGDGAFRPPHGFAAGPTPPPPAL